MKKTQTEKYHSKSEQRRIKSMQAEKQIPVWIAKQMPNGQWMLKLNIGKKDIYFNEVMRLDGVEDIKNLTRADIIFVHKDNNLIKTK